LPPRTSIRRNNAIDVSAGRECPKNNKTALSLYLLFIESKDIKMPPSTTPWDEEMSDMAHSGITSRAPSDVRQQHLIVLTPKTMANSSPTSPKSFPFFINGKGSNRKLADPRDIIEDARQAALHAAYMASRGVIVANYYNHKKGDSSLWREEESVCSTTGTNNNSQSRPSLDTSFLSQDSDTSVTGLSKDASSTLDGNRCAVSLSHLQSGKIGLDGSISLTPTKERPKDKRKRSKKIFKMAQKFGLTLTTKSDAEGKSFSFSTRSTASKPIKKSTVKKVAQGLWMCNLCGRTFASMQASEEHEAICIRMACCSPNHVPFDPAACLTTMDAPSVSSASERDVMVLRDDVRNWMCMSDQSVIKVIRAAKPYIISSPELDCERALSMLARDCAYYNHLERRDEMRREQSAR
jgi:ribosomal protein L37AE/L43A